MATRDQTIQFSLLAKDLASGKFKNASRELGGLEKTTGRVGGAFSKMGAVVGKAARVAFDVAKVGAIALAGALVASVKRAAEFEKAMLNVNSIAKLGAGEFIGMKAQVLALTRVVPQSATVLAEGLYDIQSSGFAGMEGMKVLEAAAKGASAGLTDTSVSAKGLTAILNAYGYGADKAAGITDLMFKVVDRGVVSFEELAGTIGDTTALSAPLGVKIEEVGAALALMTRKGIDANNATTQINAIMLSLLKPSQQAVELAEDLGLGWDAQALRGKGLVGVLEDMIVATGGNEEQMATLLGNSRAIRGAFVLAGDGGKAFNAELLEMQDHLGATDTALSYQKQGLAFQLGILKNNIDAIAIGIGTALLPKITPVIQGISEWMAANQGLIDQISGQLLHWIFNFARTAAEGFGKVVDFVTTNWPAIQSTAQAVWDAVQGVIDEVQGPLGDLQDKAASLKEYIITNWPHIQTIAEGIWTAVSESIKALWPVIDTSIGKLAEFATAVSDKLLPAMSGINSEADKLDARDNPFDGLFDPDNIKQDIDNIKHVLTVQVPAAITVLEGVVEAFATFWVGRFLTMRLSIQETLLFLAENVPGTSETVKQSYRDMVAETKNALVENETAATDINARIDQAWQDLSVSPAAYRNEMDRQARVFAMQVTNALDTVRIESRHVGTQGPQAVIDGMTAAINPVGGAARDMAAAARGPISGIPDGTWSYGYNTGSSIASGMWASMPLISAAANEMASKVYQVAAINSEPPDRSSPLYGITKWGGNMVKTIAGGIYGALGRGEDAASALASAMVPGFGTTRVGAVGVGAGAGGVSITVNFDSNFPASPAQARDAARAIIPELTREMDRQRLR